ncbi:hypothetical protein B0T13DRAFT_165272 [Neurospora crassa]|nr:hypothetical protein B0T13DRAFT_165272 [Neurospora crassa]
MCRGNASRNLPKSRRSSSSFRTAFKVQIKVTRYLFARCVQRDGRGYSMRGNGLEWSTSCFIAVTKLLWWVKPGNGTMSTHDPEIVHHLQRFIMNWHEALLSGIGALLLCLMDLAVSVFFLGIQSHPLLKKLINQCHFSIP